MVLKKVTKTLYLIIYRNLVEILKSSINIDFFTKYVIIIKRFLWLLIKSYIRLLWVTTKTFIGGNMLTKEKKAEIVAKFGKGANDTGSTEVQVALLTERISELNILRLLILNLTEI